MRGARPAKPNAPVDVVLAEGSPASSLALLLVSRYAVTLAIPASPVSRFPLPFLSLKIWPEIDPDATASRFRPNLGPAFTCPATSVTVPVVGVVACQPAGP